MFTRLVLTFHVSQLQSFWICFFINMRSNCNLGKTQQLTCEWVAFLSRFVHWTMKLKYHNKRLEDCYKIEKGLYNRTMKNYREGYEWLTLSVSWEEPLAGLRSWLSGWHTKGIGWLESACPWPRTVRRMGVSPPRLIRRLDNFLRRSGGMSWLAIAAS